MKPFNYVPPNGLLAIIRRGYQKAKLEKRLPLGCPPEFLGGLGTFSEHVTRAPRLSALRFEVPAPFVRVRRVPR